MRLTNRKAIAAAAMLVTMALGAESGIAQDRARDRDRDQIDRDQQVDRDQTFDRDRIQDRDQTFDRDRLRDRDRLDVPSQDRDRDRDQDRTHAFDFSDLSDREIYGSQLMSVRERNRYRRDLNNADNDEERERVREQHQAEMQTRAQEQGVVLPPTSEGPIYGGQLMTVQERNQYREQLRLLEAERQQFMAEHQERMQVRARSQGVVLEN